MYDIIFILFQKMFIDINANFDGEITIHEFMTEMTKKDPRKMT